MTGEYYVKHNQSIRLQILRNNCQYTMEQILPKLQKEFQEFCHVDQGQACGLRCIFEIVQL